MNRPIDFDRLWQRVGDESTPSSPAHGPDHWWRVQQNGLILARETGARIDVVRLFAVFHDSRRTGVFQDPDHGWRGAEYARKLRGRWFEIDEEGFRLLFLACTIHEWQPPVSDPTIATCLDANRLDLVRLGILPDPDRMSTNRGAALARKLQRHGNPASPPLTAAGTMHRS